MKNTVYLLKKEDKWRIVRGFQYSGYVLGLSMLRLPEERPWVSQWRRFPRERGWEILPLVEL